jgi:hypothetical protein
MNFLSGTIYDSYNIRDTDILILYSLSNLIIKDKIFTVTRFHQKKIPVFSATKTTNVHY